MAVKRALRVALVGRPNTGKSSLFNRLTGLNQKVGNYPGVTMERHVGLAKLGAGVLAEVVDLPGIYSLHPSSDDERVVLQVLTTENESDRCDVVVGLADGTNLKTCLFVFTQVLDMGFPAVLAVTMVDEMERRGAELDVPALEEALGVSVVPVNSRTGQGFDLLQAAILSAKASKKTPFFQPAGSHLPWLQKKQECIGAGLTYRAWLDGLNDPDFADSVRESGRSPERARADEAIQRYRWVNQWLRKVYHYDPVQDRRVAARFDRLVVHPVWGSIMLFGVLFVLFQALFYGAALPMDAIDSGIAGLTKALNKALPSGFINHFLTSGLLPGIAGVLIFLPQIALLFLFLSLLEETGYMARVVFIMDRFMRPFGLSGKSIVPLVSGTACAIPAVMSTRNMESAQERWLAIAVTPLMTCSARLPVYALIIGLVVPNTPWLGISLQGLTLFGLYALGFAAALLGSALLNRVVPDKKSALFLMEMPPYRMPLLRNVFTAVWTRSRSFVVEAGKIIVSISVVLWFLASSGPKGLPDFSGDYQPLPIEESYLGSIGRGIQPIMAPLGYDWKISVAIASSFVAREVFVGTMATLYSVDGDEIAPVRARMSEEINPDTGKPYFNLAVGVSLLLFYAFALQCMSTIAVVVRETRSWRFALMQFSAYALVAYLAAWSAFRFISYLTPL